MLSVITIVFKLDTSPSATKTFCRLSSRWKCKQLTTKKQKPCFGFVPLMKHLEYLYCISTWNDLNGNAVLSLFFTGRIGLCFLLHPSQSNDLFTVTIVAYPKLKPEYELTSGHWIRCHDNPNKASPQKIHGSGSRSIEEVRRTTFSWTRHHSWRAQKSIGIGES